MSDPAVPAVVTQASPLLVQLFGSVTAVPALCLSSYTPVLADQVSVVEQGPAGPRPRQVLVLGKFV